MTKPRYVPEEINQLFIREVKRASDAAIKAQKEDRFDFVVQQINAGKVAYDKEKRLGREREIKFLLNEAQQARRVTRRGR